MNGVGQHRTRHQGPGTPGSQRSIFVQQTFPASHDNYGQMNHSRLNERPAYMLPQGTDSGAKQRFGTPPNKPMVCNNGMTYPGTPQNMPPVVLQKNRSNLPMSASSSKSNGWKNYLVVTKNWQLTLLIIIMFVMPCRADDDKPSQGLEEALAVIVMGSLILAGAWITKSDTNECGRFFTNAEKFLEKAERISNGRHSLLLRGTIGARVVALRMINNKEKQRSENELKMQELTEHVCNVVPILFTIELDTKIVLAMPYFDMNLNNFIENKIDVLDVGKTNQVVHQIIKALATLHELCIVHSDLRPENIFIIEKASRFTVKIGNFERSSLQTGNPIYNPSEEWMAPETRGFSGKFSISSDIYSLGLISFYVWSHGHKMTDKVIKEEEKDKEEKDKKEIEKFSRKPVYNLEWEHMVEKFKLLKVSNMERTMNALQDMLVDIPGFRPTSEELATYPVFWITGSYTFYFERLHAWLIRTPRFNINPYRINGTQVNWKEMVKKDLMKEMEEIISKFKKSTEYTKKGKSAKNKEQDVNYTNNLKDFVRFLRNLVVHGKENTASMTIATSPEVLEAWMEEQFQDIIIHVFKQCIGAVDSQFTAEFCGHFIS